MPPVTAPLLERPDRWDAAFDPDMSDADVDRLLAIEPFSKMAPSNFPKRSPLREILRNDTKIRRFLPNELIVRVGDYGTSAFLILNGKARVVLKPELPPSMLGRKAPERKGLFRTLAQIFSYGRPPESFRRRDLRKLAEVGSNTSGEDEVHVYLQDVPRILRDFRTGELSEGDFFGEIAALSRMPRTSTIFADNEGAELLEIRWQGLRDLMKYDEALRVYIDQIYRSRALESFFLANPLFSKLTKAQLKEVGLQVQFATFGDYDWSGDYKRLAQSGAVRPEKEPLIVQEGDYPNGVVLVRAGFTRVSQKFGAGERTLNYLGAGGAFGLQEIHHNYCNPRQTVSMRYTLRAIGYTHVLIVPTYVMEQMILPNADPKLLPPPMTIATENAAEPLEDERPEGARIGRDYLEFLASNRFFNGTAAMVIDLDRCTRCDDCVRACAATHDNNPRFLRHGPSTGRIMIANACMHCADPVCMIGCPTGAIHRESFAGQVVINPVTCIGCTACANNCPYDAIRMVDIRDERGEFVLGEDFKPIAKATKCDLCVENYGGPACERACPHGALERMNLNDLKPLARWMNR